MNESNIYSTGHRNGDAGGVVSEPLSSVEAIQQVTDERMGPTSCRNDCGDLNRCAKVGVLVHRGMTVPPTVKSGSAAGGRQENILLLSGETIRPQLEEDTEKEARNS